MDRLRSLGVFIRVAQLGSLAAVARETGLSPAMVGNHIRALESWFARPLIVRTTRRQALTDMGREILAEALNIKSGLDSLERIRERDEEPSGLVRITAPRGIGRKYVGPILRMLAGRHPRLEFDLRLSDYADDLITSGIDLAVRNGPLIGNEASLVARAVGRQALILAAAPGYLGEMGYPKALYELAHHRTVRYSRYGRPRPWLFPNGLEFFQYDPPTSFMADDIETLRDAAVEGLGICWLPDWLVHDNVENGSLVRILPDVRPLVIDTFLVRAASTYPPAKVTLVSNFIAAALTRTMTTVQDVRN
jgi:DNA-binding transcriptional LysR family regulator